MTSSEGRLFIGRLSILNVQSSWRRIIFKKLLDKRVKSYVSAITPRFQKEENDSNLPISRTSFVSIIMKYAVGQFMEWLNERIRVYTLRLNEVIQAEIYWLINVFFW